MTSRIEDAASRASGARWRETMPTAAIFSTLLSKNRDSAIIDRYRFPVALFDSSMSVLSDGMGAGFLRSDQNSHEAPMFLGLPALAALPILSHDM